MQGWWVSYYQSERLCLWLILYFRLFWAGPECCIYTARLSTSAHHSLVALLYVTTFLSHNEQRPQAKAPAGVSVPKDVAQRGKSPITNPWV